LSGKKQYWIFFGALSSPGIWLLFERGNFDELIFILVALAALTFRTKYDWLGVILVGMTALMKFYTLPLFVILVLLQLRKSFRVVFLIGIIPLTLYLYSLISKIPAFPTTWFVSFGFKFPGEYLDLLLRREISPTYITNKTAMLLLSIAVFLISLFVMKTLKLIPELKTRDITLNPTIVDRLFIFGSITFGSCYFAGMNYDYRLIFLALIVAISPAALENDRKSRIFISLGLLALWMSSFSFGLPGMLAVFLQFAGDLCLSLFMAALSIVSLREVKKYNRVAIVNACGVKSRLKLKDEARDWCGDTYL